MSKLESPEARLERAYQAQLAGELDKAAAGFRELLREYPDYVEALYLLGMVHIQKEEYGHALPCMVQAAMHNPADFRIRVNLAGVYIKLNADEVAAEAYEQALALNPNIAETHFNLAKIYYDRNEFELCLKSVEKALELRPDQIGPLRRRARCLLRMGRHAEAAADMHRILEMEPANVRAICELSDLPFDLVKFDVLERIEKCLDDLDELSSEKDAEELRLRLTFAKARALDRYGRHEEAFRTGVVANDMLIRVEGVDYEPSRAAHREAIKLARRLRPDPFRGPPSPEDPGILSLFIIGPSRSGKTSLEKLVGAIPGVKVGFENHSVHNMVRRANQMGARLADTAIGRMPESLDSTFRELYFMELNKRAEGYQIFTNTIPGNLHSVGRVINIIPHARFVFVRRNLDDQAIRIYFKQYARGNEYSYRLDTIYDYMSWYHRMEDVWSRKFPEHVMFVSYEDMVANPTGTVAQVAKFCEIDPPTGPLPDIGDDRNCAEPYLEHLKEIERRAA